MTWEAVQGTIRKFPRWPSSNECKFESFQWWHCGRYSIIDAKVIAG